MSQSIDLLRRLAAGALIPIVVTPGAAWARTPPDASTTAKPTAEPTAAPTAAPSADEGPLSETPTPRGQARGHYLRGVELAGKQQWAEAYTEFARAQELFPAPSNLFNIGQCQRALGRYVGAIQTFREYLRTARGPQHATTRKLASDYLAELGTRVASVQVAAEPAGAEVAIDGKVVTGPATLDPGHHVIRVTLAGYTTAFVDRTLRSGDNGTVPVRLQPLPATLSIDANVPNATVHIDGAAVGIVPWRGERSAGSYEVGVRMAGYETYESRVTLRSGGHADINATLSLEQPGLVTRWWFWAGVGAVVAGVAVATYAATREAPPPADYHAGSLGWVVTHSLSF